MFGIALGLIPVAPSTNDTEARSDAKGFVLLVCVGAGAWLLNRISSAVFPKVVFAIGQGERRDATRDTVRWVVVVGLVISIASAVIVGFFQ